MLRARRVDSPFFALVCEQERKLSSRLAPAFNATAHNRV